MFFQVLQSFFTVMPLPRRSNLSKVTARARRQREVRATENDEDRQEMNEATRIRNVAVRRRLNLRQNTYREAFYYDLAIQYSDYECVQIGEMDHLCQYCSALKYRHEPLGLCCAGGKMRLTPLVPPPEPLGSLVSGNAPDSKHFLSNIQYYNNCFQMTSFGATHIVRDNFMPTVKVIAAHLFTNLFILFLFLFSNAHYTTQKVKDYAQKYF